MLKGWTEKGLQDEKAGIWKETSCTDRIATLRVILEQSLEWNSPVYTTFVNFEKAFDSMAGEVLWKLLHCYSILEKYINLIQNCLHNTESGVEI